MQHPDEGMIHTWLDGELPADEAAALEAHVSECEQCKASVAEARGFIAGSSRIVVALDNVPSGVIPVAKPVKRVWYSSLQFRAAAAVLVVAGASLLVVRTGNQKPMLADSAALNSAVVADQGAAKVETPKPAAVTAPRSAGVLSAPVRESGAARVSPRESSVTNEAEFSGKGVKGGSAFGVAGGTQVIRVDSTTTTKKTTYQSLSGREVVLSEEDLTPELPAGIVTGVAKENRQRAASAAPASAPPVAEAPSAPAPVAQSTAPIQTIRWTDMATRKRYSLSGPVSVEELEAIKARLLQVKR